LLVRLERRKRAITVVVRRKVDSTHASKLVRHDLPQQRLTA
jgi:hypothetical protein